MEEFQFMKKIKNVTPLYTQALNGIRVKEHPVSYVFDEVGCGKTISAIIAMASIIEQKENEKRNGKEFQYKILVVTPKSVCNQFEIEIKEKLNVDSLVVENIAFKNNNKLKNAIKNIKDCKQIIVVSNPHKVGKLVDGIQWDLVIIDEAHDIICNSQAQTYNYYAYNMRKQTNETSNKIDEAYNDFCNSFDSEKSSMEESRKIFFEERKEYIEYIENVEKNIALARFAKSVAVEEYRRYKNWGPIRIVLERRDNQNALFQHICKLNSAKVMFLTATPYKYDKEFDFINYTLVGTKITTKSVIIHKDNFPDLEWVSSLYSLTENGHAEMKNSNTSLMFKEIVQSIPLEKDEKVKKIEGKERKIEIWDEVSDEDGNKKINKNLLHDKLLGDKGILKSNVGQKNRVIIFVSNSKEGQVIFKKIFPDVDYKIDEDYAHNYTDQNSKLSCEFIMNKFGNASNLKDYSKEPEQSSATVIPDILIVTWQVAQVGVNLPTYNYVINYHIPPVPGYLEQRYGRIDRLNSKNNPLYNIYYLDAETSTQVYRVNLIQALCRYKKEIMDIPHNLPVKNLLICKELTIGKIDCEDLYKSLAYYIYSYLSLNKFEIDEYVHKLNQANDKLFEVYYENKTS